MAYNFVPLGAGTSIPLWKLDAPIVGEVLFPKPELNVVYPGIGQNIWNHYRELKHQNI